MPIIFIILISKVEISLSPDEKKKHTDFNVKIFFLHYNQTTVLI